MGRFAQVYWQPNQSTPDSPPNTSLCLSRLWDYGASKQNIGNDDINLLISNMQVIPALVGEKDRTLHFLLDDMAVINANW
jgi:hypothetical protein